MCFVGQNPWWGACLFRGWRNSPKFALVRLWMIKKKCFSKEGSRESLRYWKNERRLGSLDNHIVFTVNNSCNAVKYFYLLGIQQISVSSKLRPFVLFQIEIFGSIRVFFFNSVNLMIEWSLGQTIVPWTLVEGWTSTMIASSISGYTSSW